MDFKTGYKMSNSKQLEELLNEVKNCKRCRLHETRKNIVFGKGSINPSIVFVGEAPGEKEDELGLPFVGRGGMLLDSWLHKYNLSLDSIYILNSVKCRPPNNRDPLPEEKLACKSYFEKQIELLNPKILCGLGRHGFGNLINIKNKDSFSSLRGTLYYYKNIPTIATYHPAYILRSRKNEIEVFKDFEFLKKILYKL